MSDASSGESGGVSPSAKTGRRRAVAFSYSRVSNNGHSSPSTSALPSRQQQQQLVETSAPVNYSNGGCRSSDNTSSSSSSSSASGGGGGGGAVEKEKIKYQFVEKVPSDCCCGLCGELMDEPLQTQCCNTNYCQPCLLPPPPSPSPQERATKLRRRPRSSGAVCPDCKTPNVKLKTNEDLKKKVACLQVKCFHADAGCVWEGQRVWLGDHMEREGGCVYAAVVCSNCSVQLKKKDEWSHATTECRMRMVHCQYCNKEDTHQAMSSHYQQCTQFPLPCSLDCGTSVPRCLLQDHTDHSCPQRALLCPFSRFGCSHPLLQESEVTSHIASCGGLHLGDMARKITADMDKLQRQIQDLRSENESLRREVKSTTVAVETANDAVATLRSRSETLSHTLFSELEFCCQGREPHQLVAMECVRTQLAGDVVHLQAGGFPATLRMTSYSNHKESGQVWLSPAFYVYCGYKLRIGVHVNGVGEGKGSHVSIYLHQMAGERDSELQWPHLLKDRVRVSLVDQTQLPSAQTARQSHQRFFRRQTNPHPSTSPPLTLSLPPSASPLRHHRRLADEPRSLTDAAIRPSLSAVESQAMAVPSYLQRVRREETCLGGQVLAKLELFCTQTRVGEVVYCDSLVFTISLCSGNLTDGSIACSP